MSQTLSDNTKITNKISTAHTLTKYYRKSKNWKNHGSQSQWTSL